MGKLAVIANRDQSCLLMSMRVTRLLRPRPASQRLPRLSQAALEVFQIERHHLIAPQHSSVSEQVDRSDNGLKSHQMGQSLGNHGFRLSKWDANPSRTSQLVKPSISNAVEVSNNGPVTR